MVTTAEFRDMALGFQEVEEAPHFDRRAFKVTKRRIFATLHEASQTVNVKLTPVDQSVFCDFGEAVYQVPNKWGLQGWTTFELAGVPRELMLDALETAYNDVVNFKK